MTDFGHTVGDARKRESMTDKSRDTLLKEISRRDATDRALMLKGAGEAHDLLVLARKSNDQVLAEQVMAVAELHGWNISEYIALESRLLG